MSQTEVAWLTEASTAFVAALGYKADGRTDGLTDRLTDGLRCVMRPYTAWNCRNKPSRRSVLNRTKLASITNQDFLNGGLLTVSSMGAFLR